jgi:hypothetical protein
MGEVSIFFTVVIMWSLEKFQTATTIEYAFEKLNLILLIATVFMFIVQALQEQVLRTQNLKT